jgi:hypothetical protein
MKLKVITPLTHISPSSFKQMLACEYESWLLRVSGIPFPRGKQTKPMAVGSSFDSFVKAEIAFALGKHKDSKNLLAELLKNVDDECRDCIPVGKKLFDEYKNSGCLRRLLDEGLVDIELSFKQDIFGTEVAGTGKLIGKVPVFCKPDAVINPYKSPLLTPTDWKVNGALSQTGASPKPGYLHCYRNGFDEGPHDKCGCHMEDIDKDWAIQLCFYSWVLNPNDHTGKNLPVAIEQVAVRPNQVSFVSYRTTVSAGFCSWVKTTLEDLWERFALGEIAEPTPSFFLCEPFGTPKSCTMLCSAYKNILGDEVMRVTMGA